MIFSLGGLLARRWRPQAIWVPWTIAAIFIGACAVWDFVAGAGRIDFIMAGLACYELIMGLTEEPPANAGVIPPSRAEFNHLPQLLVRSV